MSQLLKRKLQTSQDNYQGSQYENIRKQLRKDDEFSENNATETVEFMPQVVFQSAENVANQKIISQVQSLQEEIEKCIKLKNFKSIARILRKRVHLILRMDSQTKITEAYQRLVSILISCLSLSPISNNFFLQIQKLFEYILKQQKKSFCDSLEEILQHYYQLVDSNTIDILFNLTPFYNLYFIKKLNIVDSGGIKECLLNMIIRLSKKNIQKCKKSIQDNQDNQDINKLSVKMKFKFIKLLYRIISDEIPESELQSSQKSTSLQNSAGGSPSKNLNSLKPAKSFQSQLIAEMVRWLQQEPLISSKVLKFLLSIESRQATIVKLCLLRNIDLNEDSQLYFLDFLKYLFQQNRHSQPEIIQKVFQYINNCTRSLSYQIRLNASQILHYFPYFDDSLLLRTIKLEQFQDYGKGGSSTPTSAIVTPSKSDQEKFSISHGYGAIVHLLEDEYNEVRKSALEIIQNFGLQNESFGRESRDILFYMLNDENDSVRIKAVEAISHVLAQELCEISDGTKKKLVVLTNEEMDTLLFNLKEKVPRLRIVIYKLLGKVKVGEMNQLNMILDITLRNINEFSDDSYIYEMCKSVGENNSSLIQKHICQILQIADILYVQEPHWKNKAHIYRFIMISNSFKNREEISKGSETLLPSYFLKQYDMMQDLMSSYFHPLYTYQQTQLVPQKTSDESIKKHIKEINIQEIDQKDQSFDQTQEKQSQEDQNNLVDKNSSSTLLNLLVTSLQEINKKKNIFKVISENARSQLGLNGPQQDLFKFINKLAQIAYLINIFIRSITNKQQQSSVEAYKFQILKILKKIHSIQSKFTLDEANDQIIQRLPALHMINANNRSSIDSFEQHNFLKSMTFIQGIIKEFQQVNNSKVQQNQQTGNLTSSSIRIPNNPNFLLHSCLEEGCRIANDVQTHLQRLSSPSTRDPFFIRYRNFLNSLPFKLIFSKRDYNQNQQLQNSQINNLNNESFSAIKLRQAKIFVPKDDSVEIQSKYMAKTGFVAEVTHFLTPQERKNLQLLVEYSDSSSEIMQLIEDDFVYLAESTHVINTNIFFQKINWTSESLASISINYQKPLSIFNRNTISREIMQLLPSPSTSSQSPTTPVINLMNASCTLAKSNNFLLIVKSRVV